MKIYITLKSPDSVYYTLQNVPKEKRGDIEDFLREYIEYGEYIKVEFDTDNKTATVVKV